MKRFAQVGMMTKAMRLATTVVAGVWLQGAAHAHDNAPIEQDVCAHQISGSWLHYSAYQPSHDPKAQYCEEIPRAGETILVIDIVDGRLRERLLAVKIEGPDDRGGMRTLMDLPARLHANGVVDTTVNLDSPGKYVVSVFSPERNELDRFELSVAQFNWQKKLRQLLVPGLLSILLVWLGLRAKRWFSKRSSGRRDR